MSDPVKTLRALVIDDEMHGRDVVKHMLKAHADFVLAGEASDGLRALEEIRTKEPDVVFLDIRMPTLSGIELVDALSTQTPPAIIFVTAHEAHAVAAFERRAFDYLLKPFDQERFDRTIERVRERFRAKDDADFGRRLREVLDQQSGGAKVVSASQERLSRTQPVDPVTRIVVKEAGRVFFVPVEATDWFEASGNYVAVHAAGKAHLVHESLATIEQNLDPKKFLRIHRSTIVNIERIKELQPFANGEFVVILRDGTRLKLSRSFRERADAALGLR